MLSCVAAAKEDLEAAIAAIRELVGVPFEVHSPVAGPSLHPSLTQSPCR